MSDSKQIMPALEESGNLAPEKLPPSNQVIVDPTDNASIHWDYAGLSQKGRKHGAPQCDQLCRLCRMLADVVDSKRSSYEHYSSGKIFEEVHHYETLDAMCMSAKLGCHMCSVLYQPWQRFDTDPPKSPYSLWISSSGYELAIKTEIGPDQSVFLHQGSCNRNPSLSLTANNTEDSKVLELARQWLRSCIDTHEQCRDSTPLSKTTIPTETSGSERRVLPSRLIHIKQGRSSAQSLHLAVDFNDTVQYLTLSHCWGSKEIVKLTTKSLQQFLIDIPVTDLPKTFSEALYVTWFLGFEYLWIDSLCIIQDSKADWLEQSQKMGAIYRNSELTLAAVKAHDSHEGLFATRSGLSIMSCQILGGRGGSPPIYASADERGGQPLMNRGWVFQEECLARRTLEFGPSQLSWGCMKGRVYETESSFEEEWSQKDAIFRMLKDTTPSSPTSEFASTLELYDLTQPSRHWLHQWWWIVGLYSPRDLTFDTDRFPAICGLASLVQGAKRISMIHGMWKYYLLIELLWVHYDPPQQRLSIDVPSWSWLGVQGRIVHHYLHVWFQPRRDSHMHATVSLPRHSQVDSGPVSHTLEITGHMLRATRSSPFERDRKLWRQERYLFRLCDGRSLSEEDVTQLWDGAWYPDTVDDAELDSDMWAIQIIQRQSKEDESELLSTGLMVRLADEDRNVFKRVGLFYINWFQKEDGSPKISTSKWTTRDGARWFGDRRTIQLV